MNDQAAIQQIHSFFKLLGQIFSTIKKPGAFRYREIIEQTYQVANGSLLIVVFCLGFAAIVTILEAAFHMKLIVHNDSLVPGFASLLIIREMGAIVTGLLLTSKVGASIASEIGLMKTTEQLDAFRMLGIDKISYLVIPRIVATAFAGLVLTIIADMTCLYFSMLASQVHLGFTPALFLSGLRRFVEFQDLIQSAVKGLVFGMVIPIIACHYGFNCKDGSEGVGTAATNSVVMSSVAIIILDFVLSFSFSSF